MKPRHVLGMAGLAGGAAYVLSATGALTLDLNIGRQTRALGPIRRRIAAPPEVVFDVVAGPYLGKTPHAMAAKLRVIERGADLVLAEHFTPIGYGLNATTVEAVRFERPFRVHFRLVRGPVAHVVETFELTAADGETDFGYSGEIGADLWALGRWWAEVVGSRWVKAVEASVTGIAEEAERRAAVIDSAPTG
jgi:Polyketide cyclase / dehydrase and lipid transport